MALSSHVHTMIIDHHLLRSQEGTDWLARLQDASSNNVVCAADFMNREAVFLEAWRKELSEWLPVNKDWHEDYAQGKEDVGPYRLRGWEVLITHGKIEPCTWYYACPIKEYTDTGRLERYWIEEYCLVSNKACLRYQMEERGEYHPGNMLPDGVIREDL